ncbi:MAG: SDR family oxidoreductase [Cyanobacteria bacterium J06621_11]
MIKADALKGKTVVLTGATRGIGLEIAHLFAQKGANLIGIARSHSDLSRWTTEIEALGVKAATVTFDLAYTKQLPALKQCILHAAHNLNPNHSKIDILINNAGVETYRAFRDYSLEEIETVIRVNLLSVMSLTRLLLPHLTPDARIVNMGSLASKKSHPYDSAYAASKAGLLMWNHSLRQELTGSNLSVCVICPGYVSDIGMLADTGISAPFLAGRSQAKTVAQSVLTATLQRTPETIVNQNAILQFSTRLLIALEQIFPQLGDLSNQWMGITEKNRKRAHPNPPSSNVSSPDSLNPNISSPSILNSKASNLNVSNPKSSHRPLASQPSNSST